MKQIKNLDLSRLRTEECFGFLQQVASLAKDMLTVETDKAMVDAFVATVNTYDAALKQSTKNSKTAEMNQADAAADTAWRVARAYAKAMSSHPDVSVAAIGKTIYDLFVKFGDLASLGFHEEYGRYYNLLQELANVDETDRETAAFDPWLNNMDECYLRFIELRDAKVTEDTTYQTGLVKESRTAAEEAYKAFVQRVNALCIVMGEEQYGGFIDQVNVVIDTLSATIAARETKAAKKRVKDEDKE